MIRRIYVEKKPGYDTAAAHLWQDVRLQIAPGILSLRLINRYDAEGMDGGEDWRRCVRQVFSEPAVDHVYDSLPNMDGPGFTFAVKYLPGQYDQRADSAVQCIQAITGQGGVWVETARVYWCGGDFTEEEKNKIKNYFINPVDSMEASSALPATLRAAVLPPGPVPDIPRFIHMDEKEIRALHVEMGLAMRPEDLIFCQSYFRGEKRNPTLTEIKVIDTYWSDHCRHTTFTTALGPITFGEGPYKTLYESAYRQYLAERAAVYGPAAENRPVTLMDMAVMGAKALKKKGLLTDLDESEEVNACSIVVPVTVDGRTEEWLLQFKNETHNHPTEIEPYGGAATCLGGAIRDPLSGRAYVYQAMRVTGSGDPTAPLAQTWPGKLPQRVITTQAAAGFSAYGNQIGLATGHVAEVYHPGYTAKRMEIGAVIGAVKRDAVRREMPRPGDAVLLIGGRTGRDGCGGATGSSKGHTEESLAACGAEVQKGNPATERKLQRLFNRPESTALIIRCNDFGAGGVCVAVGELADGMEINLDAVPKKYEGLDGTELAISESQERMAVVVAEADVPQFTAYAEAENLEATQVAVIRDGGRIVMRWRGDVIVDITRAFLSSSGANRQADVWMEAAAYNPHRPETARPDVTGGAPALHPRWLSNLRDLNTAAQKGLAERFDASIGAGTVLMPYSGKNRLTPAQAMAAKFPVRGGETQTVSLMAYGFDPYASEASPFHGAVGAVVESLAKITACGGCYENARLTFQEYFERLGEDPRRWQKPFLALLGAFRAQMAFETPSIGGKDSMSGSYEGNNVPPTLVSFAVQTATAGEIISPELKAPGHALVWLRARAGDSGLPDFEYLKESFRRVTRLIHEKKITAAYAVTAGGAAAALTKMALGNYVGAEIETEPDALFVSETGSFVLEMTDAESGTLAALLSGLDFTVLGRTVKPPAITVNGTALSLAECEDAWLSTLEEVFPTRRGEKYAPDDISVPLFETEKTKPPAVTGGKSLGVSKPRVFIPVFPGSNCEYDTARAFERAGARVDMLVVRNQTPRDLEASVREMEKRLNAAQILMLAGGFSAGDEPDGSGKFITALFRSPFLTEATHRLLYQRDGLALGICNGFQALVKLGLLLYGEIHEMADDAPTLTYNAIGRHVSDLVMTKTISNLSPWLWNIKPGDTHLIPVSHGEGRFTASGRDIQKLIDKHQIATQYVDFDGQPSMDIRYNPNGSLYAIEGICSPDGRVLGKMGHSERIGDGLYKGFDMPMDQRIFEAGVQYFK